LSQVLYRRKAILTRIRQALDAYYLLQKIDWEYDMRSTLEKILGLALEEIEFEGGRQIERGLIIIQPEDGGKLEIQAGWKAEEPDLTFSRTVVQQTLSSGEAILCENAKDDPRFMGAESIKHLETLSLISVPLRFEGRAAGALYIESKSPRNLFHEADVEFLKEFTDVIAPYLKTAITHQDHLKATRRLQEEISGQYAFGNIIGRSASMENVFDLMKIASEVDRTVLLTGESGCGKELVARAIHHNGRRRAGAFLVVDCSSLSEHLLESELFGHRKGAFTGASDEKIGAFEEANGGTILLDEISDASKPLQQKLRRVLQESEVRRVGENLARKVDVRVICATNKNLSSLVEQGDFIRDLYFRINKFPIQIPPLRERKEDIPLLVEHFLQQAETDGILPRHMHPEALELLMKRSWSENNVRELRNTVELAVDFCTDGLITPKTVERVFAVQQGEPWSDAGATAPSRLTTGLAMNAAPPAGSLVQVRREGFQELLARASALPEDAELPKEETPFYRVQLEAAAQAIIEGLRASGWKLRPAARVLGISPTKLRNALREFLEQALLRSGGDLEKASASLEIPLRVLVKKAGDLGLDEIVKRGDGRRLEPE
jgi:transcriptional regulator with GAF, ATPase, and Fis domain